MISSSGVPNNNFWGGSFRPVKKKSAECEHGSVAVWFEEPEYGAVMVHVQFDHTCAGGSKPPSNDTVYSFEVQLDNYGSAMYDDVTDLEEEVGNMTDSQKLAWINENLVHTE